MSGILNAADHDNHADHDDQVLLDKKKRQEEFLAQVESNLRRSEKSIWFIKDEDRPQKESLSSRSKHTH